MLLSYHLPHPSQKPHSRQSPIHFLKYLSDIPCYPPRTLHLYGCKSSSQSKVLPFLPHPQRRPGKSLSVFFHPHRKSLSYGAFPDYLLRNALDWYLPFYSVHLQSLLLPSLLTDKGLLSNTQNFFHKEESALYSLQVQGLYLHP